MANRIDVNGTLSEIRDILDAISQRLPLNSESSNERRARVAASAVGGITQDDIINANRLSYSKSDAEGMEMFTVSIGKLKDTLMSMGTPDDMTKIQGGLDSFKLINESIKGIASFADISAISTGLTKEGIAATKETISSLMDVFNFDGKDAAKIKATAESVKPAIEGLAALNAMLASGIGNAMSNISISLKVPHIKNTIKKLMSVFDGITPPSKETIDVMGVALKNITGYINAIDSIRSMGGFLTGRVMLSRIDSFRKSVFRLIGVFIGQGRYVGVYEVLESKKALLEQGSVLRSMISMASHMFDGNVGKAFIEGIANARYIRAFERNARNFMHIFLDEGTGLYTMLASPRVQDIMSKKPDESLANMKASISSMSDIMALTQAMPSGNMKSINPAKGMLTSIIGIITNFANYDEKDIAEGKAVISSAAEAWGAIGGFKFDFIADMSGIRQSDIKREMDIVSMISTRMSLLADSIKMDGGQESIVESIRKMMAAFVEVGEGVSKIGKISINIPVVNGNVSSILKASERMSSIKDDSEKLSGAVRTVEGMKALVDSMSGLGMGKAGKPFAFGGLKGMLSAKINIAELKGVISAVIGSDKEENVLTGQKSFAKILTAITIVNAFKGLMDTISLMGAGRAFSMGMMLKWNIAKANLSKMLAGMNVIYEYKKPKGKTLDVEEITKFSEILNVFSKVRFIGLVEANIGMGSLEKIVGKVKSISKSAKQDEVDGLLKYMIPLELVCKRFKTVGGALLTGSLALTGALVFAIPAFLSLSVYKGMLTLFGIGMIKDWHIINTGVRHIGKTAMELTLVAGLIGLTAIAFEKISWKSIGKVGAVIAGMSALMLGLGAIIGGIPAIAVGMKVLKDVIIGFSIASVIFSGAIVVAAAGIGLFGKAFEGLGGSLASVNRILGTESKESVAAIGGMIVGIAKSVMEAGLYSAVGIFPFILMARAIRVMTRGVDDILDAMKKISATGGIEAFKNNIGILGSSLGGFIDSVMAKVSAIDVGQNISIGDFLGISNNSTRRIGAVGGIIRMTSKFLKMMSSFSSGPNGTLRPVLKYDRDGNAVLGAPVDIAETGSRIGDAFGSFVSVVGGALDKIDVGPEGNDYNFGDFFGFTNKAKKRAHVVGMLVNTASVFAKTISGFVGGGDNKIRSIVGTNDRGEAVYGDEVDVPAVSLSIAGAMSSFVSTMTARLNEIDVNASANPTLRSLGIGVRLNLAGLFGIGNRDNQRLHVMGALIDMSSKFAETLKMMASGDKKIRTIKGMDDKGNPVYNDGDGVDIYSASLTLAQSMGLFVSTMVAELNKVDIQYSGAVNAIFGFKSDATKKVNVITKVVNSASEFGKMIMNFSGEQGKIRVIESYDQKGNPVFSKKPLDVVAAATSITSAMGTFVGTFAESMKKLNDDTKGANLSTKCLDSAIASGEKFSAMMSKMNGKVGSIVEDTKSLSIGMGEFSTAMGEIFSSDAESGPVWSKNAVANINSFSNVVGVLGGAMKKMKGFEKTGNDPKGIAAETAAIKNFLGTFNSSVNDGVEKFSNILPAATKNYITFTNAISRNGNEAIARLKEMTEQVTQLKDVMAQMSDVSKSGLNFIISSNGQNPDEVMKNNGMSKPGNMQIPGDATPKNPKTNGTYTTEDIAKAVYIGVQEGLKQGLQLLNLNAVVNMPDGSNVNNVEITMFRG